VGKPVTSKPWPDAAWCAVLFLAAALVRCLFLASTVDRDLPFSIFYYGDSRIYREFALALLRGDVFDQGIPLHPPGFAFVLSWVIARTGERPAAMRAVLAILSATVVPIIYMLGRSIWSRAVGITAALLATFSFGLCVIAVSANAETIYIPLLAGQALLVTMLGDVLSGASRRNPAPLAIASGVVLGFGALTRAEHLGLALVLPVALWIGWPEIPRRRVARVGLLIAGIGLVVTVPWSIHNHRALTRYNAEHPGLTEPLPTWVGVSGTGPLVFALGNNASTDGTFKPDAVVAAMGRGTLDLTDPAQTDVYLHGYRRGFAFLAGQPGAGMALLARKLALAGRAHALGFGLSNWPAGLKGVRRPVDVFTPDSAAWIPFSLILLLAGVWVSRAVLRRASILWLIVLFVVAVTLSAFGYARFFLQLAPFVFLFQAAALVDGVSRLTSPGARRAVAIAGVVLALLLTVELAAATSHPRNFRASGSADPTAAGKISQDALVRLEPAP
jgi:4-amino-4-deoxy-L-arabinose transferase-like glycosyltransferase